MFFHLKASDAFICILIGSVWDLLDVITRCLLSAALVMDFCIKLLNMCLLLNFVYVFDAWTGVALKFIKRGYMTHVHK